MLLKPVNMNLALLSSVFRLVFTAIIAISFLALVLLFINAYSYGVLIAVIFFISHLFVLGYLIFKSGYIPRILGVFLILAAFSYLIVNYGNIILPKELYEALVMENFD